MSISKIIRILITLILALYLIGAFALMDFHPLSALRFWMQLLNLI